VRGVNEIHRKSDESGTNWDESGARETQTPPRSYNVGTFPGDGRGDSRPAAVSQ